jgi:hypothetical protein
VRFTVEALSDLSVGDVRRVSRRYVPVAAVVAAIVLMGLTLPGPDVLQGLPGPPSFTSPSAASTSSAAATTVDAGADVVGEVEAAAPVDLSTAFSSAPARSAGFADSPTAPVRLPFPSGSEPDRTTSDRASTGSFEVTAPSSSDSGPVAVAPAPLRVKESAWASRTAGTPLANQGVPASSLPVGNRLGQADKLSFVRLSGVAPTLTLREHEDASGQRTPATAIISACRITDGSWKAGEAVAFDAAPAYDDAACTPGVRAADGTWTFDLQAFPQRSDDRGFALVPGPESPIDFQVAFKVA